MSPENNKRLFERFPQFLPNKDNPYISGMDLGFRCADGWFQLVWDLCTQLEPLARELKRNGKRFEVQQVKSKFGELRVYVSERDDAMEALIQAARQRSIQICEICGKPGTCAVDAGGWWATLCNPCRQSAVNIRRLL